ncbi:MAG TPA: hypothetical protein DIT66_02930 [Rhodobiaceae bacterium]|nr:hypothetical protein [Rhodobiaceae bacterium]HCQ81753.1 hypothetical protein [Rhodobiaceae bacterium]
MDVRNFVDFFLSTAALPFLALLIMMLIAFAAIIIFWLQSRRLKLVLEDMYARHQQLAKAVNDMRLASLSPADGEEIRALSTMLLDQGKAIGSLQAEIVRLADGVNQQEQISRAIEMARQGAKRAGLVEATGISAEQADAIVKFHGKNIS